MKLRIHSNQRRLLAMAQAKPQIVAADNAAGARRCWRLAALGPLLALAACGSVPSLKDVGVPFISPALKLIPDSDTTSPPPTSGAPATAPEPPKPITPTFTLKPDEVKAMLIRADPKACSATSDASGAEIAATYAKIALLFGSRLVVSRVTGDGELQRTLDEFRPYLRQLSRNTTWLPASAERLIGEHLYASNGLQPYTPPARHKALLDKTIQPIFDELVRFARDDLKSPVTFELRVVRDDTGTSPSAIAGGIVIVPSGMFSAMSRVKQPEQVIAFMLAHEFSHVLRRHKTKMVQMSLVDAVTMAGEYRKLAAETKSGFAAARGIEQQFSFTKENVASLMEQACKSRNWLPSMEQNQEFEADVCGAMLLGKLATARRTPYSAAAGYAGYLSAGLASKVPPQTEGRCPVMTSHPQPEQRMLNLNAYAPAPVPAPAPAAAPAPRPPPPKVSPPKPAPGAKGKPAAK